MNPDTGHLINLSSATGRDQFKGFGAPEGIGELKALARDAGYLPVPKKLQTAAEKKLAGKDEAHVSLTSGGKLSKWAAKKRKQGRVAKARKQQHRKEMGQESKRRNRAS